MPESGAGEARRPSLIDVDGTFLPVGRMRQICRVTGLDCEGIRGEVDLGAEHWVYQDHFPGDPIFPGTLMVEAAGQLVALWAWSRGQRGRPRLVRTSAEFYSPVGPTSQRLDLYARVKSRRHLSFAETSVWAGDVQVATVNAVLAVLGDA